MNKEQIDFVKHCGEHFEVLTGGRGYSKTKQIIEELQQELTDCKKKLEMYENPDDLTLFYMWLDEKAKDKIRELADYKERNEKAIDKLYCWGEVLDADFQKSMLEILDKKDKE